MKWSVVVLALAMAGCSSKSESPQAAYDLADEAHAEAERANNRVSELEMQLSDAKQDLALVNANLESQMRQERLDRAADFASLNAAIANLENQR